MKKEFLTVGELAQLMGTTVRTLQYYDKIGLLKPSSMSEGGRRLYSPKDIVKLHQILSFKYLGFSLEEIKNKLFTLDTPKEVAIALKQQKTEIEEQITKLEKALEAVNSLYEEVTTDNVVDFSKYAEIIEFLKSGNQGYWIWKYLDKSLQDHIRHRFGFNKEAGLKIFETYQELLDEAICLKRLGEPTTSNKNMILAEKWWNMILEFTGGDMTLLPKLEEFNNSKENWNNELARKQKEADEYLNASLGFYITNITNESKESE